jgi:alginate O-acetyltransferase complex protein AlgI
MLFNSYVFIFAFLPMALIGYFLLGEIHVRAAATWLVAASLLFYSWWNPYFLVLLCGSIAFNYLCGYGLQALERWPKEQTLLLVGGISANLALLCFFKYLFPLLSWVQQFGLTVDAPSGILLPLGISFFTFTQIGYLVDCKSGLASGRRLLDYVLFVSFFPHLIAGPILHHREIMPQFAEKNTYRPKLENILVGLTIFVIGLAKKVIIADKLAEYVAISSAFKYPEQLNLPSAWSAALCYSMQLYFDFSGYSDMAVGLARMFGVRFPANFNSPYKATCIIDFWQRWHVTLTRYITLYIYNPIAHWMVQRRVSRGRPISRKGTATLGGFSTMVATPLIITMVLAGVWHGAGLQFIVFGLLHAGYLTINHAWRMFRPNISNEPRTAWFALSTTALQWSVTYLAVLIAQVFFRSTSVSDATKFIAAMCGVGVNGDVGLETLGNGRAFALIAGCFAFVLLLPNAYELTGQYLPVLNNIRKTGPITFQWRPNPTWGAVVGMIAAVAILFMSGATEFLYFQF